MTVRYIAARRKAVEQIRHDVTLATLLEAFRDFGKGDDAYASGRFKPIATGDSRPEAVVRLGRMIVSGHSLSW